jgi:hypothetical protein
MPNSALAQPLADSPRLRERSLVSFPKIERIKLVKEAQKKGLRLATYIRMLVLTHPDRASGAGNR